MNTDKLILGGSVIILTVLIGGYVGALSHLFSQTLISCINVHKCAPLGIIGIIIVGSVVVCCFLLNFLFEGLGIRVRQDENTPLL